MKYKDLEKTITAAISSGKYHTDDVLPTEEELCGKYDISRSTVRLAYNSLEKSGIIYREKGRGTFVKGSRRKRSIYTIGLIFDRPRDAPFIGTNVYINARMEGMRSVLSKAGHTASLIVVDSEHDDYCDLERMTPDGVLDLGNTISPRLKRLLTEKGIPLIGVSGGATPRYDDIPYVLTDEAPGAKEAVEYCIAKGYDSFGFIGTYPERYLRFNELLAEHGRSISEEHTFMLPPMPWYNVSHIKPAMNVLDHLKAKASHPSLYFFSTDEVAYHFTVLREASEKRTAEYGIIGFGNVEEKMGIPEHERMVSTINSPAFESGAAAAEMVVGLISGNDVITRTVSSSFIPRKTTR
ncbi:MAG: GntR family transcriptional regulator [Spirochaetota bacterium]